MADPLLDKYGTSRNGHAIFAPSAAASWLNCSGSLLVNARAGDTAGVEAAEGTVAHFVAEVWNKYGCRPDHLIGQKISEEAGGNTYVIEVTSEMLHHVGRFVEWCAEVPGEHYVEQRVDLSVLTPIPGQGGTADHFACERGKLTITDLKYGTGVRVFAERNPQAMLYAAGAFLEWDWIYGFQEINIRICQPRLDVFEVWTCARQELLDFMEFVKQRAKIAWDELAPRTPSPKACRWCAADGPCPAQIRHIDAIIDQSFGEEDEDSDATEVTSKTYLAEELQRQTPAIVSLARTVSRVQSAAIPDLSTKALAYTLGFRSHVERFFASVAATLLERAEKGEHIPYFKLTDGRKRRRWRDAQEAAEHIEALFGIPKDTLMPPTMISVKKAESAIRAATKKPVKAVKEELDNLVNVFATKRSLAPLNDDRPDVDELTDDFDTEDDE